MCVIAVMPPALPRSAFTSGDWGKMAVNFPSGEENSVQSDCAGAPLETNTRRGMTAAANQWECRMDDSFTLYLTIQVRVLTARAVSLLSLAPYKPICCLVATPWLTGT